MKEHLHKAASKLTFTRVVVVVALLMGFYFLNHILIVQPKEERAAADAAKAQQQMDETFRKHDLDMCKSEARANYELNWSSSCETGYNNCINSGLSYDLCARAWDPDPTDKWNCTLNTAVAKRWDDNLKQQTDDCYRQYPQ